MANLGNYPSETNLERVRKALNVPFEIKKQKGERCGLKQLDVKYGTVKDLKIILCSEVELHQL